MQGKQLDVKKEDEGSSAEDFIQKRRVEWRGETERS